LIFLLAWTFPKCLLMFLSSTFIGGVPYFYARTGSVTL
jgi:hypothetical protein